jgi:hypothetical protein
MRIFFYLFFFLLGYYYGEVIILEVKVIASKISSNLEEETEK